MSSLGSARDRLRLTTLSRALLPSLVVLTLSLALTNVENVDFLMHFLGGVAIAWGMVIIVKDKKPSLSTWLRNYLAFSTTAVIGILWEFHEWVEDYYFLTSRQPDLTDTMNDLLMDLLGAVFIILVLDLSRRYKQAKKA
ncbi:hypothetical protein A3D73_03750 [Candidatus Uhrbacteria bacterium RIFCSPHIGHO2_02_FULL_60_44]|nr:MAG: hypothetical protein A3D73_03750 [Candidatus Uhrbacteria bacterium RIFCSPHIGHO2_02_FULL_60_44]